MQVTKPSMPLEAVSPGQVLAQALVDQQGQVLLPQGTVLTEATLATLARRGIAELVVQQPAPADVATAAQTHAAKARLATLFRKFGSAPGDVFFRAAVQAHRLGGDA
jgi:hypothetical protein